MLAAPVNLESWLAFGLAAVALGGSIIGARAVYERLGEIKGFMDSISRRQDSATARANDMDERLRTVEQQATCHFHAGVCAQVENVNAALHVHLENRLPHLGLGEPRGADER